MRSDRGNRKLLPSFRYANRVRVQTKLTSSENITNTESGNKTTGEASVSKVGGDAAAGKSSLSAVEALGIFILAFALRLLYNFALPHVNNFATGDAYEYINNAKALLEILKSPPEYWQKCFNALFQNPGTADINSLRESFSALKGFQISGPVFPAFLALCMVLSGSWKSGNISIPLLLGNSLVSALSCALIAGIAREIFDRRTALLAGVIAAFYPGFIVNSGRLCSETFAAFLTTALIFLVVRGFSKSDKAQNGLSFAMLFAAGFSAGALQLTRSIMVLLTASVLPFLALQQRGWRRIGFIIPFTLGIMLTAAPWMAFQKLAFGSGGILVDRVGSYNIYVGNNLEGSGWVSDPEPDFRVMDPNSLIKNIEISYKRSATRWFRLMLDKPIRLLKSPWNDFKASIGPISFRWQVLFHEIILLLSLAGISLCTFLSCRSTPFDLKYAGRFFLLLLVALHSPYLLFDTLPRYALTAIPELIIFASAALFSIKDLLSNVSSRSNAFKLSAGLILLFVLLQIKLLPWLAFLNISPNTALILQGLVRTFSLFFVIHSMLKLTNSMSGWKSGARAVIVLLAILTTPLILLQIRANGRVLEWHSDLAAGEKIAEQALKLPADLKAANYFLLIDCENLKGRASDIKLRINGTPVKVSLIPGLSLIYGFENLYEESPGLFYRQNEYIWNTLTTGADCNNTDIRQWFLQEIPGDIIKRAQDKAIAAGDKNCDIEISLVNASKQPLRLYGSYKENGQSRLVPAYLSYFSYSWEKTFYGAENAEGLNDSRYDGRIYDNWQRDYKEDLSNEAGIQNGHFNMAIIASTGSTKNAQNEFKQSKSLPDFNLSAAQKASFKLTLPSEVGGAGSFVLLSVSGKASLKTGKAFFSQGAFMKYRDPQGKSFLYASTWGSRRVDCSAIERSFGFTMPFPSHLHGAKAEELELVFQAHPLESEIRDTESANPAQIQISETTIESSQLPNNPIDYGNLAY